MHDLRTAIAIFLLANVLLGLTRVVRGPTIADRILVAQLFGTTAVAVLLLLGAGEPASGLDDVALVFSLFASVTVISFVRNAERLGGSPR